MADALAEEQVAEFREILSLIDKDADGLITLEELATIVQSLDRRPTIEEIRDMICEVDIDGNRTLDFEEFLNVMGRKQKENVTEELKEAFKVFDRNQDGYISGSEVNISLLMPFEYS
ncbi:hypothetical protein NC651_005193 [Populus alba x Populus x berolinensis]|nr:hypothetical protein NC651_005193 [Populus alba x Populus x berolinensis]